MSREPLQSGVVFARAGVELVYFDDLGAERAQCEAEVVASNWPLPLQHRMAWDLAHVGESVFLAARLRGHGWSYALTLRATGTRSLPGHCLLRVERVAPPRDLRLFEGVLAGLRDLARARPRALRLNVELFGRDESAREKLASRLAAAGYRRPAQLRSYAHTLVLDLAPEESALFADFNRLTRRSCRKLEALPLEVHRITDAGYEARMSELYAETMDRTGGRVEEPDWAALRALSGSDPALSSLVGLFRQDESGPAALLAFLWGAHHGDHVCYEVGASTRATDVNLPLSYALMWHLIRWARSEGATWFDLGGVTLAPDTGQEDADPLAGISEFKRGFSKQVAAVGDEWQLSVRPVRDRLLDLVSGAVNRIR